MSEENLHAKEAEKESASKENEDIKSSLRSISPLHISIAVLCGLAVVVYMFVKEFKLEEFNKIQWNANVFFWLGMAVVFMITRHLSYMARLRIVTNGFFSWKKCFELIVLWEFSSAVTPTSVGGSAVALFALSQEKLSSGRTTMIVLYTVILDTLFFLSTILFLFLFFGPIMVQPGAYDLSYLFSQSVYGPIFFFAFCFMFCYGFLFFYGVFINTKAVQRLLHWLTGIVFLKRFRKGAEKMGEDMLITSSELRNKSWRFHLKSFLVTFSAWTSKFMVLNCLVLGFVSMSNNLEVKEQYQQLMSGELDFSWIVQQIFIYSRQLAMWIITAISPTPGGSGVAENAFMTFHNDYIPKDGTLLLIMAVFWRFFTYYVYLIVGMIVVPNWVRKIINKRKATQPS